jgi:hypothetical protein
VLNALKTGSLFSCISLRQSRKKHFSSTPFWRAAEMLLAG